MALCSLAVQEDNVLDLEDGDRKLVCAIAIYQYTCYVPEDSCHEHHCVNSYSCRTFNHFEMMIDSSSFKSSEF